jgi:hypothetical protein
LFELDLSKICKCLDFAIVYLESYIKSMKTQYFLLNGLLVETLLTVDSELLTVLEQSLLLTQQRLQQFAADPGFSSRMALAFGTGANAAVLQAAWLSGDFSILSGIEILGTNQLNGANGAYAISTDRVYVSLEFLGQFLDNPEGLVSVLLEEVGHRIDGRLNQSDSSGDEGAIFAALVRGESLSEEGLARLKAEDDRAFISLNGEVIQVEQQNFAVTNTNDSGVGSLRWAIENANSTAGSDTVTFNIPGAGVQTIRPLSPLPEITDAIIIDGTTQPGYSGSPLIELDGSQAGTSAVGLVISAGNSTVKGLVINRFRTGIDLLGDGTNLIQGNYIGTDATGTVALGNNAGISIFNGVNNVVRDNLISGNIGTAVSFFGGTGN